MSSDHWIFIPSILFLGLLVGFLAGLAVASPHRKRIQRDK